MGNIMYEYVKMSGIDIRQQDKEMKKFVLCCRYIRVKTRKIERIVWRQTVLFYTLFEIGA